MFTLPSLLDNDPTRIPLPSLRRLAGTLALLMVLLFAGGCRRPVVQVPQDGTAPTAKKPEPTGRTPPVDNPVGDLNSESPEKRRQAAAKLQQLQDPAAVPALFARVGDDRFADAGEKRA